MPIHLLQVAKKLAHDAGLIALDYQKKAFNARDKSSAFDLVTDADLACEKLIIDTIKKHFPDHSILSEEAGEINPGGEYKWIVDPIDGTTNFTHGLPLFCISIGIVHQGKPIIGVVEIPALRETFHAQKDRGAFRNESRIFVSQTSELKKGLFATGFPYSRGLRYKKNMELWDAMYENCHGVRRIGSAAIDLCYTACGRFDGYWEYDLKAWDIAAGKIILEEAGGTITNMDGSLLDPKKGMLVASNTILHSDMLEFLKKHGADKV